MPDECIHGFEAGLCDTCFPKPVPVAVMNTTTTTRSRTGAVQRAGATRRAGVSGRPDHKVGEQRIYHVTHIDNLPFIIESDAILADALLDGPPAVDVSSVHNRQARREATIGTATMGTATGGTATVADFVPFFLSPGATVWDAIRTRRSDPRLAKEIRDLTAAEFVILVSTVKVASTMEMAVADGDAAHSLTRFATTPEGNDRALRTLRADESAIVRGELLVRGSFPFELVALVGVANDRARDAVKEVLQAAAHEPKVAVYPPWFIS